MVTISKQFIETVFKMRQAQREYFKTRNYNTLRVCKALECDVDNRLQALLAELIDTDYGNTEVHSS